MDDEPCPSASYETFRIRTICLVSTLMTEFMTGINLCLACAAGAGVCCIRILRTFAEELVLWK